MGLGIASAAGPAGGYGALDEILAQRIAAQKYADLQKQQQFENSLNTRKLNQQDELTRLKIQEMADAKASTAEDKLMGRAATLGDQVPPGVEMMPNDVASKTMLAGGQGALMAPRMTLRSTQTGGGMTMPGGEAPMSGILRTTNRTEAQPEVYTKLASTKQQDIMADNARQDRAAGNGPKLPQREDDTVVSIHQMSPMIDRLIRDTQDRIASKGGPPSGMFGQVVEKGGRMLQGAAYSAGLSQSKDVDQRIQLESLLQILGTVPYLRGSRNYEFVKQIQQHLADPTATDEANLERLQTLQQILPEMEQAIYDIHNQGTIPHSHENMGANAIGGAAPAAGPPATGSMGKARIVSITPRNPNQAPAATPAVGALRTATPEPAPPQPMPQAPPQALPTTPISSAAPVGLPAQERPSLATSIQRALSPSGLAALQQREGGFVDHAYPDVNGLAIGYGMHEWKGQPVTADLRVTKEEADAEMARQVRAKYAPVVDRALKVPVTQGQYDALISMAWNLPAAAKQLVERLNRGEQLTAEDFQRSATVHGQPNRGVSARRASEFQAFQGGK